MVALQNIDIAQSDALPLDSIICGDCLDVLRGLPDNSVDAIITDPPAGIEFMGKEWDSFKQGRLTSYKKQPGGKITDKEVGFKDFKYLPSMQQKANPKCQQCNRYKWDHVGRKCDCATPRWEIDTSARATFITQMTLIFAECLRVLKPGGHALVWALPRTSHWTATALEDAGWEIRDRIAHINGSGFPKSLDVSKAIDKQAGAKRKVVGINPNAAREWDGWGTALKPSVEDWWLCRKPLAERNVAANVLRWGVGALNIEASRVGSDVRLNRPTSTLGNARTMDGGKAQANRNITIAQGRFPSHLLLSHSIWCSDGGCSEDCPIRALDAQSGTRTSGLMKAGTKRKAASTYGQGSGWDVQRDTYGDTGGSSCYFQQFAYVPKASRAERNRGCDALPERMGGTMNGGHVVSKGRIAAKTGRVMTTNSHPTVKPLALMTWLIRLITPAGGVVLDPFAGSGSTLVAAKAGGWRYIGIEKENEYVQIAAARLEAAS